MTEDSEGRVLVVAPVDAGAEGVGSEEGDAGPSDVEEGDAGPSDVEEGDAETAAAEDVDVEDDDTDSPAARDTGGSSARGNGGSPDVGEQSDGRGGDGEPSGDRTRDEYLPDSGREYDPQTVAAKLAGRLPVEVVFRCGSTATEYVEELGPTLDCVVVFDDDTDLFDGVLRNGSVPTIVCDSPVVEGADDAPSGPTTIQKLADRVGSAVHADRTRSELRDSNARLTALSRYAEDITACETVDAVIQRTLEATTDALAFDHSVILLVEGDRLVPRASDLPAPELSACDVTEGIAGRTLATGESEIVDDMQTDPDAVPEHDDLHAVISVPIGEWGVIQIASNDRGAFDERDAEFVEILAGYAREALERLEREVTLREERDRLHAFYDALPIPALCVERRDGRTTIEDVNHAYEEQFGEVAVCQLLSNVVPSDAERDHYETTLGRTESSRTTVTRQTVDGETLEFTLTVIPVSQPTDRDCAFGVYRDAAE